MNPATMDQESCDRWLGAEHEGLRRMCQRYCHGDGRFDSFYLHGHLMHGGQQVEGEDPCGNCHGLGYVPAVDLESLMVAMAPLWVHVDPWQSTDGWTARIMEENPSGSNKTLGFATGDTPLLAASRAAVAAKQEEAS